MGDDVEVVSYGKLPDHWSFKVPLKNYEPHGISMLTGVSVEYLKYLASFSRTAGIVHGHGIWRPSNLFPFLYDKNNGIRMVCSTRGMLSVWSMNHKKIRKMPFWHLLQRPALQRLHCFHVTASNEMMDIRRLGFRQPVVIIPNGIDIPDLSRVGREKQILYLGRINPVKGLDLLLQAWQSLVKDHPDWHLVVAGALDSPYALGISRQATAMGLERIRFVGAVYGRDKQDLLDKSALFVLPSYSENFGVAVAEALASAVPVITTTATPWKDLEQKKCGWYVKPEIEDIKSAMGTALRVPAASLQEMGSNGRKWMTETFSWETVATNMKQTYELLLANRTFDVLDLS